MSEYTIEFESERDFHKLYCEDPDNLRKLEELFGIRVVARGSVLKVNGDAPAVEKCKELFALLQLGREQGMIVRKSDFFRFMESASGEDLSWWWRGWYLNNWQLDMAITAVEAIDDKHGKGTKVSFLSNQKLVMPATLRIQYSDNTHEDIRIPVETWMRTGAPSVILPITKTIKSASLDPDHKLPDADRSNNTITL